VQKRGAMFECRVTGKMRPQTDDRAHTRVRSRRDAPENIAQNGNAVLARRSVAQAL